MTPSRLLDAYRHGIFPWFNNDQEPIQWWSPDPRAILFLDQLKISKSLAKRIRRNRFKVTMDKAFNKVVTECAAPRTIRDSTWITPKMVSAYVKLFQLGYAHSVESWSDGKLVGGLYGVSLGRMFFGESMFSKSSDASKVALAKLVCQLKTWEFDLIDCQIMNDHLESLGVVSIPRAEFLDRLVRNQNYETRTGKWTIHTNQHSSNRLYDRSSTD